MSAHLTLRSSSTEDTVRSLKVATSRRGRSCGTMFLAVVSLTSTRPINGQRLRPALDSKLAKLSAASHSSVLLWDLPRSETLAAVRAEVFATPHCLGSLVKPFLLLAYLSKHCSDPTPHRPDAPPCPKEDDHGVLQTTNGGGGSLQLRPCVGHATAECPIECWFKSGHGRLEMGQALAVSCNQYFYQLSKLTSPAAFFGTLTMLNVGAGRNVTGKTFMRPETMMGLDSELRLVPLQVLKAYGALISGHSSGETGNVTPNAFARTVLLTGLRLSAVEGTSALAEQALPPNHHLLGKTGTSPAFEKGRYLKFKTDGWFLGFYPAAEPVLAVMVYYPGGLGAKDAAPLGGQAVKMYLEMVR